MDTIVLTLLIEVIAMMVYGVIVLITIEYGDEQMIHHRIIIELLKTFQQIDNDHVQIDGMCHLCENGICWLNIGVQKMEQKCIEVVYEISSWISRNTLNFRLLVTVPIGMRPSAVRGPSVTIGRLLLSIIWVWLVMM